jgi:hypothetical protein
MPLLFQGNNFSQTGVRLDALQAANPRSGRALY